MQNLTFDQLPQAVSSLFVKLEQLEQLIAAKLNDPSSTNDLLTIDEAAKVLNLSKQTLYGLNQRAEIPVCKKGKRLYYSRHDLMEWIKTGRKQTANEISANVHNTLKSKAL